MWVARDKNGTLYWFEYKPKRKGDEWISCRRHYTYREVTEDEVEGAEKVTWEDDPKEVIYKIKED